MMIISLHGINQKCDCAIINRTTTPLLIITKKAEEIHYDFYKQKGITLPNHHPNLLSEFIKINADNYLGFISYFERYGFLVSLKFTDQEVLVYQMKQIIDVQKRLKMIIELIAQIRRGAEDATIQPLLQNLTQTTPCFLEEVNSKHSNLIGAIYNQPTQIDTESACDFIENEINHHLKQTEVCLYGDDAIKVVVPNLINGLYISLLTEKGCAF